jgi:hypothetical protein
VNICAKNYVLIMHCQIYRVFNLQISLWNALIMLGLTVYKTVP